MGLYTPVLALMILAAGFAIFSVIMSAGIGPKRYNRAKLDSYECGIEPLPSRSAAAASRSATTSPR